jgi:hypothetical protein
MRSCILIGVLVSYYCNLWNKIVYPSKMEKKLIVNKSTRIIITNSFFLFGDSTNGKKKKNDGKLHHDLFLHYILWRSFEHSTSQIFLGDTKSPLFFNQQKSTLHRKLNDFTFTTIPIDITTTYMNSNWTPCMAYIYI